MAELTFRTLNYSLISPLKNEKFSVMYFGQHFGKGLLILQHSITVLAVFGDNNWSNYSFFKTIAFRGDSVKGVQISGAENLVFLLDVTGNLWKLANSFDRFEGLDEDSFYEWVPFNKLNFSKVLSLTATKRGFIFLGMINSDKKLVRLPSINSHIEEFHFDELAKIKSFSFYLTNLSIDVKHSIFKHSLAADEEILLIGDRHSGKIYLCSKNRKYYLVTQCNIPLVSVIHFQVNHVVLLCLENGKILLLFYKKTLELCTVNTHKKIAAVEKCFCSDNCFLWSDGFAIRHTSIVIGKSTSLCHLQMRDIVETPIALLRTPQNILLVTANNIYYLIEIESSSGVEVQKTPKQLFLELHKKCEVVCELESELHSYSYFLYCRDLVEKSVKFDLKRENNYLLVKSLGVELRKDFWKLKLNMLKHEKKGVEMVNLEHDLNEGMVLKIKISFKEQVEVSLVGNFKKRILYFKLGVI